MKRFFLAAALTIGLSLPTAYAEDHPPRDENERQPSFEGREGRRFGGGGRWRKNPEERRKMRAERLAQELGLSEAQKEKMQQIRLDQQRQVIKLRAEIQLARLDLNPMLQVTQPDPTKIAAQVEKIGKIEIELKKIRILTMVKIKAVLTPEQAKRFQEIQNQRRQFFKRRFGRFGGQGWRGREDRGFDRPHAAPARPPQPPQPPPSRE